MTAPQRQPDNITDQVRQVLARATARGEKRPGRPALARELGVTEHQVRRALADLDRQTSPAHQVVRQSVITFPDRGTPTEELPVMAGELAAPAGGPGEPGGPGELAGDRAGELAGAGDAKPPIHRGWLVVLALPAFVAVWGGWVGLGGLAGFGPVALLPGIADGFTVNLAVTLPAGMEVYAVIGLRVWLSHRTRSERTRRFAMWSSVAALSIGCFGQVLYHVLAASRDAASAPVLVVVFVACLPVAILGAGAALFHLTGEDAREVR